MIGDFDVAVHCVASALEAYSEAFDVTVVFEQVEDRDLDRPILGPAQVLEATRLVAVVASIGTVVDGLVDDRRARPGGTAVTIVDLVVEPRLAVEIRCGREQHRGVVEQPGAAAVAAADRGDDQRIAVVLDVVGEQAVGADDDRVVFADRISGFGQGEAVSDRRGGIVDRRDGEADTSGRSGSRRVADDVVEIRRAPIVIGRRDVDQAVAAEADRDVAVALDRLDSQHVAVDIEIVGDQRPRIDGERSSFGNRGDGIVARNRSVVDRGYLDRDFGLGAPALGCIGDVGEFGGAVEIGSRREGNVAVARQRHRPVLRAIDLADDHPVSIEIVRKQPLDPDHEATVLGDGEAAVGQRGRDRADADIDARGVEAVAAVRQRVGDRGRAVIAADRSVANVALGIEGRHAVGPAIDRDDSQRVAIGVEIVAQDVARLDRQLKTRGHREIAVVGGGRGSVVEELADGILRPGHPVGEGEGLYALRIGRQGVDDRQAVVGRGRERDNDGLATAVQTFHLRVGSGEIDEANGVDVAACGRQVLDGVGTVAACEGIAIAASAADEAIVARAVGEAVVAIEAMDVVVPGTLDV